MIFRPVKTALISAREIYQSQRSIIAVCKYVARFLFRRGPSAIRRRIEARNSLAQIRSKPGLQLKGKTTLAVLVQGAIGDNIIAARFLRDLKTRCHDVTFDIFTANLSAGRWIYGELPGLLNCFQDAAFDHASSNYVASLLFEDTVRLVHVSSEFNNREASQLSSVLASIKRFYEEHLPIPFNHNGVLAQQLLYAHGQSRPTAAQFIAGIVYGGDRYALIVPENTIAKFELSNRKYITVHNGFDVAQVGHNGSATKVYPRFDEVIAALRKVRPEFLFVQIGASTSVQIAGTDLNLIGKTSLPEAAALVKGACCHLDNEGGLVTVASCYGTPCCVVFGPSSPDYFSYIGNVGVRPLQCGGCWWLRADWLSRCPRGMAEPVCMYTQPPSNVANAVLQLLETSSPKSVNKSVRA